MGQEDQIPCVPAQPLSVRVRARRRLCVRGADPAHCFLWAARAPSLCTDPVRQVRPRARARGRVPGSVLGSRCGMCACFLRASGVRCLDGVGAQVARVSACTRRALVDAGASLQVGLPTSSRGWGAVVAPGAALASQPSPLLSYPLPRETALQRSPFPWQPCPTSGTRQGSTSPCPVGSWAAGRPGPQLGSAGPQGPPAGPAPSTVSAERPSSRS